MKTEQGFTLVELMVTLVVATLLLTLGVPAMREFVQNGRIVGAANEYVTAIHLARNTAIKRQRNAEVCVSTTWNAALPTCTGGADWGTGWVVWVDQDADAAIDAGEVIRVGENQSGGTTIEGNTNTRFRYDATGIVNAGDTVGVCDGRSGETGRQITVTATGRVNIDRMTCL